MSLLGASAGLQRGTFLATVFGARGDGPGVDGTLSPVGLE